MKFLTTFVLLGLPGVAFTSRLDSRQGAPSGNSSAILPPQSLSSQKEPAAPSLVAISSPVTNPPSIPKQERGPQGGDSGSPPGPLPELPLGIVTPAKLPPEETSAIPAATPTSTDADTNTKTPSTLAFSSLSTTAASTDTSLAELTTIITTNSLLVDGSPSTTLLTSKIASGAVTSTRSAESGTTTIPFSSDLSSPTQTATMSNPTATPSSGSSNDSSGNSTLTIALSTVLSVVGVILIAAAAYLCTGGRRKRIPGFNRGITPIGDDEIATWKSSRLSAEKATTDRYTMRPSHSQNASTSTRRAPSVIQYQHGGRPSLDVVSSPRSFIDGKYSFDLPQAPGAVLARAPNARSGLTDDMVPGDDPFLPSPKRHPSRLHKLPPGSPSTHGRTKGSRSSSLRSFAEAAWRQGEVAETSSPRGSSDAHSRNHYRIYSNSTIPPPPRLSFGDSEQLTGLSPPPSRRQDSSIGLAVG
ncbi:hypothetical protein F4820DRAFT_202459 [Hypoxylon rubiginosum]|uniref:Uncharacterized protein n=1 Tax=Hypoxylon rubiginosum TaxID=110542 RepID=A0ACB9Z7F5_9PEZI|nr:hypothetical protein F4820DRAFT_202459 [Hypoxylon rubiginosum]